MNEINIDPNISDEEIFSCDLSDAASENAAMVGRESVAAVTPSFCTGLDTYPVARKSIARGRSDSRFRARSLLFPPTAGLTRPAC